MCYHQVRFCYHRSDKLLCNLYIKCYIIIVITFDTYVREYIIIVFPLDCFDVSVVVVMCVGSPLVM